MFTGGDDGVIKVDSGVNVDFFDKCSASNKDTLCFVFVKQEAVFIKNVVGEEGGRRGWH